jgi:ribosome-binding factor A
MVKRLDKVNSLIEAEAARAFGRLSSPGALPTVTAVETGADLANATVWVSVIPDTDEAWELVDEMRKPVQAELAEHLVIKRVPRIALKRDRSAAGAQRVDELLKGKS